MLLKDIYYNNLDTDVLKQVQLDLNFKKNYSTFLIYFPFSEILP